MDRNETIQTIRENLKKRSGKTWSVTGGRGTAWGWLTIDAPPARRTAHHIQKPGTVGDPEDWDLVDTKEPNGYMTPSDINELGRLLDQPVHYQGKSIPTGHDYWEEYIDRSAGRTPARLGQQYWD